MKKATNQEMLNNAINETIKEEPDTIKRVGMGTIRKIANKFLDNKLHNFPALCEETRRINWLKQIELKKMGNKGGWSEKKDFKFDYTISHELYMFMVNMVYREFWKESQKKVWRSFMKAILRGDEPMVLLRKVKSHYDGINSKIAFR